jgi:hypothetical protein
MRVKVYRVIPTHAQDTAALGCPCFGSPEHRRLMQWPGRERDAGCQASLEQVTAVHTLNMLPHFHRKPSL